MSTLNLAFVFCATFVMATTGCRPQDLPSTRLVPLCELSKRADGLIEAQILGFGRSERHETYGEIRVTPARLRIDNRLRSPAVSTDVTIYFQGELRSGEVDHYLTELTHDDGSYMSGILFLSESDGRAYVISQGFFAENADGKYQNSIRPDFIPPMTEDELVTAYDGYRADESCGEDTADEIPSYVSDGPDGGTPTPDPGYRDS